MPKPKRGRGGKAGASRDSTPRTPDVSTPEVDDVAEQLEQQQLTDTTGSTPTVAKSSTGDDDDSLDTLTASSSTRMTADGSDTASITTAGSGAASATSAGAGSTAATVDDSYLTEALPGEELHHRLMQDALSKINITTSTYQGRVHPNSRDILVENLTVILKGRELMHETDLQLAYGHRYALVGPNGCGKSLLLTIIGRRLIPLPANMDVYHLASEIEPTEMTALEAVLAVDTERTRLQASIDTMEADITGEDTPEQEELNAQLCEMYERMEDLGAGRAEARAAQILHGLGFTVETMNRPCRQFSGGWRMRVALARALFVNPTLLLLDDPSNHLDMHAVVWLENYLKNFKKILLMVSHSEDFMNEVCSDTIRMHQKRLWYFGGNYDTYMRTRTEIEENQMKRYEKQQENIASIKDFVARFGHGTKKLARQAQSREKLLAKVLESDDLVEKVEKDAILRIRFPDPGRLPPPVLMLQNVSFAYPGGPLLFNRVDFGIDLETRVALVGENGKGKTTLLKLLTGELIPTTGAVRPHPHLRIARYTQHYVDTLDLHQTPLEFFQNLLKDDPPEEVRKRLGRFGVSGDYQSMKMAYLSDGIKSRVVFAQMALRTPHLLLLDEPTNGLSMEMIDSLAEAINEFKGGVVLVSHDMRLISKVANDIYECGNGTITKFPGDIMAYKEKLKRELEASEARFEAARKAQIATGKA